MSFDGHDINAAVRRAREAQKGPWRPRGPTGAQGPTGRGTALGYHDYSGATGAVALDPEIADLQQKAYAKGMIIVGKEWLEQKEQLHNEFVDAIADYHDKLPRFTIFRSYKVRLGKLLFKANPWWKDDRRVRRARESGYETYTRHHRWN